MMRQLFCMLGAAVVSVGIIVGVNYMTDKEIMIHEEVDITSMADEDLSVGDYAYDNYSDDFWKTNNYDPVEYVMASVSDSGFSDEIEAEAAILIDIATNEVIYEKNPQKQMAPASTTKLATAITAIEILDLNQVIVVGNEINLIASDSSKAGLEIGEQMTFKELMQGMLLSSVSNRREIVSLPNTERISFASSSVLALFRKSLAKSEETVK